MSGTIIDLGLAASPTWIEDASMCPTIQQVAAEAAEGDAVSYFVLQDLLEEHAMTDAYWEAINIKKGDNVIAFTLSLYWVGELVARSGIYIAVKKVHWIPEFGRFEEAYRTGKVAEVEQAPEEEIFSINVGGPTPVISRWPHDLSLLKSNSNS